MLGQRAPNQSCSKTVLIVTCLCRLLNSCLISLSSLTCTCLWCTTTSVTWQTQQEKWPLRTTA